nr:unnamed protein product [Digitaria exilis]
MCTAKIELLLLGEEHEQALRSDEDLVEEADEAEPDDGRDVDAAERRDDPAGDDEEGLGGRGNSVTGSLGYHDMTMRRMKRKPSADSAGPATPATAFAVAGSRSPNTATACKEEAAWHGSISPPIIIIAAAPTALTV